jgi:hypothetical protein
MNVLIVLYAGMGVFLMALAVPFILQRVGPNPWAGFRIQLVFDNPELWYPANRYAGWWMLALGAANLALALVLGFWPGMTETAYLVAMTCILLGGLLIGLIFCWRYAQKLAQRGK